MVRSALVAIDTGGTFTDAVVYDPPTGRIGIAKALTSYDDLIVGMLASTVGAGIDLERVSSIKHGTTQVINCLLQRDGARTALVTTAGFRDVLELRRGNRPVAFDLDYVPDAPLVPRELCFEVHERTGSTGEIVEPLRESDVVALAGRLVDAGVESVAVSFINAYAHPAHEQRTADILRANLPASIWVTTGTDASREWYEYERSSTAVANAYVAPRVSRYVEALETRLTTAGFRGALYLMASHGGVLPADQAAAQPTTLVESGPIGGVIGAGAFARALGLDTLLAFDMGGTTAKCAVVQNGTYDVVATYHVGGYERGFPIRARVLDIVEVGSGGGSIASVDDEGRLSVGPRSAGSNPGPVAFGRGGREPTVTDANLVLGRIAPGSFLDGDFELDVAAAEDAIVTRIGDPLGYAGPADVTAVAKGILEMATLTMVSGIKQVSLDRGYDLSSLPFFVFGGGGPLHGAKLAEEVGATTVIVPPLAGNFSAVGMLIADARLDDVRTFNVTLGADVIDAAGPHFQDMEAASTAAFGAAMPGTDQACQRYVGMRFAGQRHELNVALYPDDTVEDLRRRYLETYRRRFGHVAEDAVIETTVLRSSVTALTDHLTPSGLAAWQGANAGAEVPIGDRRTVHFDSGVHEQVPFIRREDLRIGFGMPGPAVIEEYGATTLVPPGWHVRVGDFGELWLRHVAAERVDG
ncbi:hydantoinase/oxoprolinase family protein [uncultured Jatrophihabitans sp.]|uniref:hydantoinase/oxoprolinase family protein n=1 Tax=uncultured Jatrophihabitans sp. TaxID=1610747 RepID=UPI0035CABF81